MKKWIVLFWILLSLIMTGCKTIEYVYPEYELPAEPQREILEEPKLTYDGEHIEWLEFIKDLGLIINYYDSLVSQWEEWAVSTKEIITIKD